MAVEVSVVTRNVRSVVKSILQSVFGMKLTRRVIKVVTMSTGLYTQSFETGISRNVVVHQLRLLLFPSLKPLLETL